MNFPFFLDFAVVAKLQIAKLPQTEGQESCKTKDSCSKGKVMQALRQKCNQLIFQEKNPMYHKGKYIHWNNCKSNIILYDGGTSRKQINLLNPQ